MRHPFTCWLALPAAAVITAVLLTNPVPPGGPPAPLFSPPEPCAEGDRLNALRETVRRRIAAKDELVSALIEGRLMLVQVVAEFHRLNGEDEAVLSVVRQCYPGATDEEKVARNVLHFVSLRDLPAGLRTRVQARLEREFVEAYALPASAESE